MPEFLPAGERSWRYVKSVGQVIEFRSREDAREAAQQVYLARYEPRDPRHNRTKPGGRDGAERSQDGCRGRKLRQFEARGREGAATHYRPGKRPFKAIKGGQERDLPLRLFLEPTGPKRRTLQDYGARQDEFDPRRVSRRLGHDHQRQRCPEGQMSFVASYRNTMAGARRIACECLEAVETACPMPGSWNSRQHPRRRGRLSHLFRQCAP